MLPEGFVNTPVDDDVDFALWKTRYQDVVARYAIDNFDDFLTSGSARRLRRRRGASQARGKRRTEKETKQRLALRDGSPMFW